MQDDDDQDLGDDVWDKLGGPTPAAGDGEPDTANQVVVDVGPPVRATFVIRAERVPIAPWAQGWRVGSIGPEGGHVTLVCEHDIEDSPVAQLAAVTGLLGTIKQARLEVVWWTIQTRGPLELDAPPTDMDAELRKLLGGDDEGA
ncbi:MAG: hypothetical protein JWM86_711 [Thermoleophilia bacterium]|nr:hypothetical protein [Thermoleophilia bacterium]